MDARHRYVINQLIFFAAFLFVVFASLYLYL